MKFTIAAWNPAASEARTFLYDNVTNILTDADGNEVAFPPDQRRASEAAATTFDAANPLRKSRLVKVLKVQLGLSCNYGCEYCSQRFVARPDETAPRDVARFIAMLDEVEFDPKAGLKIEFWGGEPFVYWKTLKPLAEALRDRFESWPKAPVFSTITNGSLLTREINDWLVMMGFHVGLSHDGPGQSVRGPDPLDDPAQRAIILNLYKRLRPMGRMSFNSMLNAQNTSRKAIHDFFVALTGDQAVPIGEGGLIDAYDEGGLALSLRDSKAHAAFRRQAFNDIRDAHLDGANLGFNNVLERIDGFIRSVLMQRPAVSISQKCGMDDEHVLAVDLRGNVLTCHNTSAVATAPNGRAHLSGHMTKLESVAIHTSTHWSSRPDCADCPVLHLCKGSCMYLEDERWRVSCDNAYSDNVVLFAAALEKMTGFIPVEIISDDPGFPVTRRDVWGTASLNEGVTHVNS